MAPNERNAKTSNALPLTSGDATARVRHLRSRTILAPVVPASTTILHNLRSRSVRSNATRQPSSPSPSPTTPRPVLKIKLPSTKMKNLEITDLRLGMLSTLPAELRDTIFEMALSQPTTDEQHIPVTVYKDDRMSLHFTHGLLQQSSPSSKISIHPALRAFRTIALACPALAPQIRAVFFSIHTFSLTIVELYYDPNGISTPDPKLQLNAIKYRERQILGQERRRDSKTYIRNAVTERHELLGSREVPSVLPAMESFEETCLPYIRKLVICAETRYTSQLNVPWGVQSKFLGQSRPLDGTISKGPILGVRAEMRVAEGRWRMVWDCAEYGWSVDDEALGEDLESRGMDDADESGLEEVEQTMLRMKGTGGGSAWQEALKAVEKALVHMGAGNDRVFVDDKV